MQDFPTSEARQNNSLETLGTNQSEDQVNKQEQRHRAPENEIEQHRLAFRSELVAGGNVGIREGEEY